jgi:hypothetical protein
MYREEDYTIRILDVNDPPTNIRLSSYTVSEKASIGTTVGTLLADDEDARTTNPCSLWKVDDSSSHSNAFKLSGTNIVVTAKSLDHESQKAHPIVITCVDYDYTSSTGRNKKTASATVIIDIKDEHEPPISITLDHDSVDENSAVNTKVGTVTATDQDTETLTFKLVAATTSVKSNTGTKTVDAANLFKFGSASCTNPNTGTTRTICNADILVKGKLDYEDIESYDVIIFAYDSKSHHISKRLTLHVNDVNEAPTDILLGSTTIDENAPGRTLIGNIDVEDPDNPDNYTILPNGTVVILEHIRQNPSCNVDGSKFDGASFKIDGQYPNFHLVSADNVAFNYEKKKTYKVSVTCEDHGRPSLSLTKTFQVMVNDLNEVPTAITTSPSPMSVKECAGIGSLVAKFSTVDEDVGQSYIYAIVAGNLSVFDIRGSNLVVKYDVIDFETEDEYEITVQTKDNGFPSYTFEDTFVVDVVDCPEPPTDIFFAAGGTLPEQTDVATPGNTIIGYTIGEVEVVDQDHNQNPQCKLLDNANNLFNVSSDNTLVITAGPRATKIDYESLSNHEVCLKIRCTDTTGLYLDKVLCVNITDVNEPATSITLNGNLILENMKDEVIGDISVTGDPDAGQNHNCTVIPNPSSEAGNQEDPAKDTYVKRRPQLGESFYNVLASKRALDYEAISSHSVVVNLRCCDIPTDGQTSLCIEAYDFQVLIGDVNEVPQSPCDGIVWYVAENQQNGTNITDALQAYDPDNEIPAEDIKNLTESGQAAPQKQHLTYSLVNERSVPFRYNEQLQQIQKVGFVNYEARDTYSLLVNVMDDGKLEDPSKIQSDGTPTYVNGEKLNKTFTCTVKVTDVNEHHTKYDIKLKPVRLCTTSPYLKDAPAVYENAVAGTRVATLSTTDPDKHDTHTYRIESIGDKDEADIPFQLTGPNKDILEVKGGVPLDFESSTKSQISVPISSTDKSGYTVHQSFVICIDNVNEGAVDMCLVDSSTLNVPKDFEVPENDGDYVVGQVIVTDPDKPARHCPTSTTPGSLDPSSPFVYNCTVTPETNDVWTSEYFTVDEKLVLKTTSDLNYEDTLRRVIKVPVFCADMKHPLQSPIFKTFTVKVTDVNEPTKNFMLQKNHTLYHTINNTLWFGVKENAVGDIATIKYTDEDGGQDHTFIITPAFDARYFTVKAAGQGAFSISTSGLNAEAHNGECINITVQDNGKPPKSGSTTICFMVQDVPEPATDLRLVCSDNNLYGRPEGSTVDETKFTSFNFKPTFQYGKEYARTDCHQIRQVDFKTGWTIGTAVALDEDGNGVFTFTLKNYADVFEIGPVNKYGSPTTGKSPAFSLKVKSAAAATSSGPAQVYNLQIEADGQDGLASQLTLKIRTYNECDSLVVQPNCGNEASCVAQLDQYDCACNTGLVGNPKLNGDDGCKACPAGQQSDEKNPPSCVDTDECASNPCQNGATCNNGDDLFTCICLTGFEGNTCETNQDDCSPNPCKNGGVCSDLVATYRCTCPDGYIGHNCEEHTSSCDEDSSVCKSYEQCVYASRPICVTDYDVAQTHAQIEASKLTNNGLYGAETHIEFCLAHEGDGRCPLSLKQAVDYANQPLTTKSPVERRAVGYKYKAKITSVEAWPDQDEISLIELVLFDREDNDAVVSPFGAKGVCELIMKTDLRCVDYSLCLDINRLGKACNPDVSNTNGTVIINPSAPTPIIINPNNPQHLVNEGKKDNTGSDPFFKTLYGRITIVAICVAIIIVVAIIIFMVLRNKRQQGAYYEDFDDYDADESGMPDENIDRDLPSMSGSMRARARPRSGLVNPLYDAMMPDDDATGGTIDNELYKPSEDIKIQERDGEGVTGYHSDMTKAGGSQDPIYDNPQFD